MSGTGGGRDEGGGPIGAGHPDYAPPRPVDPVRALRWLMVLPAGVAGWYGGVLAGVVALAGAERFCPPAEVVSGLCTAPWFDVATRVAMVFGAGVAAVLVVLLPVLAAPSFRGTVAWTAYGFGAAAAGNLAWLTDAWIEMMVAVAAGFVTLWLVLRRWRSDGRAATGRRDER